MKRNQFLLSLDATSGAVEQDPLSVAAANIAPPAYPVIAAGQIVQFEIKSAIKKPGKKDPSTENLELVLVTTKETTDKNLKPLAAGFRVTQWIGLSETTGGKRDRTMKDVAADLGVLLRAVNMKDKTPRDIINDPSILNNCLLDAKVGINKETTDFPESNSLKYVPAA